MTDLANKNQYRWRGDSSPFTHSAFILMRKVIVHITFNNGCLSCCGSANHHYFECVVPHSFRTGIRSFQWLLFTDHRFAMSNDLNRTIAEVSTFYFIRLVPLVQIFESLDGYCPLSSSISRNPSRSLKFERIARWITFSSQSVHLSGDRSRNGHWHLSLDHWVAIRRRTLFASTMDGTSSV